MMPYRLIAEGVCTVAAAATPAVLVATAQPCAYVWVGAPVDANGAATNTKPAFVGRSSTAPKKPVAVSNFEGVTLPIEDANKCYVKVGVNGETVAYQVFGRVR